MTVGGTKWEAKWSHYGRRKKVSRCSVIQIFKFLAIEYDIFMIFRGNVSRLMKVTKALGILEMRTMVTFSYMSVMK